jgi:putative membrane protein
MADAEVDADTGAGARAWLVVYLKGACMGAADTVPGVSGGTIAVIVGVYERLIAALTSIDPRSVRHVASLHTAAGRATLAEDLLRMDVPFLLALGAGVLSAAATIASAMSVAVERYPAPTNAFFFGLIAASAVVLYRHVDVATPRRAAVAAVGVVLAFLVTDPSLSGGGDGTTPPVLFVAGAIAISAMVLPGVSGAFLLYVMGQYEAATRIPRDVVGGVVAALGGDVGPLLGALVPFVSFVGGALVGLFSVAYLVRAALERHREATLVFLVSLMVGALRLPVNEVRTNVEGPPAEVAAVAAVPVVVGAGLVFALDRHTDDLEY